MEKGVGFSKTKHQKDLLNSLIKNIIDINYVEKYSFNWKLL